MLIISIICLALSAIILLFIPIVINKKIEELDNSISELYDEYISYKDFRSKSNQSLKEYDSLNIIYEIYQSIVPEEKKISFISDNINERVREALRLISFNQPNIEEYFSKISSLNTTDLFKEIELNEVIFNNYLENILKEIKNKKKLRRKIENINHKLIIFVIMLNVIGYTLSLINTHISEKETKEVNRLVIEKLK